MIKAAQKSTDIIQGLMDYLSETGEEKLIKDVSRELKTIVRETNQIDEILVTSAVELRESQKQNISEFIKRKLKLNLPLINKIDKSLIGGFRIKVGDWLLDASLKHQLDNIKQTLLE
jgi:F-type H+-transporting ATPase subunit delta